VELLADEVDACGCGSDGCGNGDSCGNGGRLTVLLVLVAVSGVRCLIHSSSFIRMPILTPNSLRCSSFSSTKVSIHKPSSPTTINLQTDIPRDNLTLHNSENP